VQGGQTLLRSWAPTARTPVLGVIGDPVHNSLSPVLHNAGLAEMDLDWVYVAFPVASADGPRAIDAARVLGVIGLSVTMPHKVAVIPGLDRLGPIAERLGAVNTVIARDGEMIGESTDGAGLIDALQHDQHWDAEGQRCVVLGTGGAARAVILALAEAGAIDVAVVGRNQVAAASAASLAGERARVGTIADISDAHLVLNATSVGMAGGRGGGAGGAGGASSLPLGIEPARLEPGQLVVDLIYAPASTPLLDAAGQQGCRTANGLGMLVHQAGRQLAAWTGQMAPLAAMAAAGQAELTRLGSAVPSPGGSTTGAAASWAGQQH